MLETRSNSKVKGRNETPDPLAEVVSDMEKFAQDLGLQCFYAESDGDRQYVVWDNAHDSDWRHFLTIAKNLDAKIVYVVMNRFDSAELQSAMGDSNDPAKILKAFRDKIGLTASVDLAFIHAGACYLYETKTAWYEELEELLDEEDQGTDPERDKQLVAELAVKLANHPRYNSCKTAAQRQYLLDELTDRQEPGIQQRILHAAEKEYFMKVKPKEDERLKKESAKLRQQGLTLNAIAQKLGISRDRVSGLLSD